MASDASHVQHPFGFKHCAAPTAPRHTGSFEVFDYQLDPHERAELLRKQVTNTPSPSPSPSPNSNRNPMRKQVNPSPTPTPSPSPTPTATPSPSPSPTPSPSPSPSPSPTPTRKQRAKRELDKRIARSPRATGAFAAGGRRKAEGVLLQCRQRELLQGEG